MIKLSATIKWLDQNSNTLFAFIAALANITLWVMAGEMAEGSGALAKVSSLSLGCSMSFGLWGIFRKTAGLQVTIRARGKTDKDIPNPRFWLPATFGGFVMLAEVALLSAVIVARARSVTLDTLMPGGWLWAWGAGRVSAAGLVLVALAVTGKGEKPATEKPAIAQDETKGETKHSGVAQVLPLAFTEANLLAQYDIKPEATDQELEQVFQKSHTAIGNLRKRMIADGKLLQDGKTKKAAKIFVVTEATK